MALAIVIFMSVLGYAIYCVASEERRKAERTRERRELEAAKPNQGAEILKQPRQIFESEREKAFKAQWERLLRNKEETKRRAEEEIRKKAELFKNAAYLSQIDPIELENLCLIIFAKLGYEAKPTSRTSDNGADGFLKKDGKLTILQCKRYQGVVGEPILRDLLGTMHHFGASSAIIVTTGNLTYSAKKWIEGKPIRVINKIELADLIKNNITEADLISRNGMLPEIPEPKVCPECGSPLEKQLQPARAKNQLPPIYLACSKGKSCGYRKRLN